MNVLPDVVTHNYHPDGLFLANICDHPTDEAQKILQHHRDSGRGTLKANYLRRRLETEAWLIAERQRLLGAAQRLEQFQQKCETVLRPELRKNKDLEH
jgi:hypothetical protein